MEFLHFPIKFYAINLLLISFYFIPVSMLYDIRPHIGFFHIDFYLLSWIFFIFISLLNPKIYMFRLLKVPYIWIVFFWISITISFFFSPYINNWAVEEFVKLNISIILFMITILLINKHFLLKIDFYKIIRYISIISFIISICLFIYYILIIHFPFWAGHIIKPSGISKNVVAYVLSFSLPLFLSLVLINNQKNIYILYFIIFYVVAFATMSRELWLALIGGFFIMNLLIYNYFKTYKYLLLILKIIIFSTIIICLGLYFVKVEFPIIYENSVELFKLKIASLLTMHEVQGYHSMDIRKYYYLTAIHEFLENPIIAFKFGKLFSTFNDFPHSTYLWLLAEFGLLPFMFYILFIAQIFYNLWRLAEIDKNLIGVFYSFISVHIDNIFIDNLTLPITWLFYIFFIMVIFWSKIKLAYKDIQ